MKLARTWIWLAVACVSVDIARAQLQIVPDKEPQSVFSGEGRKVAVVFQNPGEQSSEANLRAQIYQATSATVVAIGKPADWKTLQVLPGQTVLESAALDFPPVKAETKFIVQWLKGDNHVIGKTEVQVYPTDLLTRLGTLAGEKGLGVFDPDNELKPLLKNQKVAFEDLEDSSVEHFSGRLAIIGPFKSAEQMRESLAAQIKGLAKKNTGVVWLQPPPEKHDRKRGELTPTFYSVIENTNAVVVVQPEMVSGLAENPQAQQNLVRFCQLAMHPEPLHLPGLTNQP